MLQCYSQCEDIAAALMELFAVALGLDQHHFDPMLVRHHSNMQVRYAISTSASPHLLVDQCWPSH